MGGSMNLPIMGRSSVGCAGTRAGVAASIGGWGEDPTGPNDRQATLLAIFMSRLLILLAFALAPLLASAHEGHHSAAAETSAPVGAEAKGTVRAIVAAPSRCPGGEESCCCHDAACTSSFQPVAIDAWPVETRAAPTCSRRVFNIGSDEPRGLALVRYSPRAPPARS